MESETYGEGEGEKAEGPLGEGKQTDPPNGEGEQADEVIIIGNLHTHFTLTSTFYFHHFERTFFFPSILIADTEEAEAGRRQFTARI